MSQSPHGLHCECVILQANRSVSRFISTHALWRNSKGQLVGRAGRVRPIALLQNYISTSGESWLLSNSKRARSVRPSAATPRHVHRRVIKGRQPWTLGNGAGEHPVTQRAAGILQGLFSCSARVSSLCSPSGPPTAQYHPIQALEATPAFHLPGRRPTVGHSQATLVDAQWRMVPEKGDLRVQYAPSCPSKQ